MQAYHRARQSVLELHLSYEEEEAFVQEMCSEEEPAYYTPRPLASWELPCPSCGDHNCTHCAAGIVVHCCICGYHADLSLSFLKELDQADRNHVMFEHLLWAETFGGGSAIDAYL